MALTELPVEALEEQVPRYIDSGHDESCLEGSNVFKFTAYFLYKKTTTTDYNTQK